VDQAKSSGKVFWVKSDAVKVLPALNAPVATRTLVWDPGLGITMLSAISVPSPASVAAIERRYLTIKG